MIELASDSDAGRRGAESLRRKMALDQANGAQLGWLLFSEPRAVELWPARPAAGVATAPQRLENATRLEGGDALPGLVLELEEIWTESRDALAQQPGCRAELDTFFEGLLATTPAEPEDFA